MAAKRNKSKQVKDVSALVKFFFTLGVLAILLFIGIYIYAQVNNSPSAVVDEYVSGFMAKSPSRIFRTLNLTSSRFITSDRLDTLLDSIADYDKITSYSLVKTGEEEDKVFYQVNYMMGRLESPFSQTLTLKKTDETYLLFFKKWVIDSTSLIAKKVSIRVPTGTKLRVDDIPMTEEQIHKTTDKTTDYEMGDMFIGEHTFVAELDGFRSYTGTFTLEGKDYGEEPVATVKTSMLSPDGDSQMIVKKLVARIVPILYQTMLQRRSFDFLLSQVAIEAETRDGLRQRYESMCEKHIDSRTHLTFVDFGEFDSKVKSTIAEDDCYALCVDTVVPYKASSTVVDYEERPRLEKKRGKLKFRSVFHYSSGQWWLYESEAFGRFVKYIKE